MIGGLSNVHRYDDIQLLFVKCQISVEPNAILLGMSDLEGF